MEMISVPKERFEELERKADMDEELLISLVRGLEDIKAGRVKLWERKTKN